MDKQHKVAVKAVKGKKAFEAGDQGGQDAITESANEHSDQKKPRSFRGIKIHDKGPDSWGIGQRGK